MDGTTLLNEKQAVGIMGLLTLALSAMRLHTLRGCGMLVIIHDQETSNWRRKNEPAVDRQRATSAKDMVPQ